MAESIASEARRVAGLEDPPSLRPRCYIYARVSPKPKPDDTSVDRQIEVAVQDAEDDGFEVIRIYADRLISASDPTKPRPDFERMLSDLDELRPGDRVYVWIPDRLIRQPAELERIAPMFLARGITVRAHESAGYDLSSEDGLLMARIYGAIAAKETAIKSKRVRLKLDENVRLGKSSGGGRAFGFTQGNHEVDPEEGPILRDLCHRFLAGGPESSISALSRELNTRGLRTPRGNLWSASTVRAMLGNPRIAGIRTSTDRIELDNGGVKRGKRREIRTAAWDAIIPVEEFRKIEAVLAGRSSRRGRAPALLTGFLVCGKCGARMVSSRKSQSQGGARVYVCARANGPDRGCKRNTIYAEPVERILSRAFLRFARGWKAPDRSPLLDQAHAEVEEIRERRAALGRLVASGAMSEEDVIPGLEDLRARESRAQGIIRAEVDASSSDLRDLIESGTLEREWPKWEAAGDVASMRAVLSQFVISVEIRGAKPGSFGFDEERIGEPRYRGETEICQEGVSVA